MDQINSLLHNLWFQLFTIVFIATVHGFGAAWLAVRMLFRPHYPVKFLGLTVFPQGMIPRHRERLANAIGKAVGNELMSQETIVNALFKTDFFRTKVSALVQSYAAELLQTDYPSLLEALPKAARNIVIETLGKLQNQLGGHILQTLQSEETAAAIEKFVGNRINEVLQKRVAQVIDTDTFNRLLGFTEAKLKDILTEKALAQKVREFVGERVDDLANTQTSLREMLTEETILLVKERLGSQIQPIIRHLGEIATQERTRNQIGSLVKHEINDFYEQLPFFQRIFVSREKLHREVDDLVNTSLPKKVDELLRGETFAIEAQNFLNTTIDGFLNKPLPELVGQIAPEKLERLKVQISDALLNVVQGEEMQQSISGYLFDTLHRIRPHSLKAIIEKLSPEAAERLKSMLTKGMLTILQREETANAVNAVIENQIEQFMILPVGKLSDRISSEIVEKATVALTERIVAAAEEKLPTAIAEFNVGEIVREKVSGYPADKLENLVLSIAKEHLRTIELFGAVIGLMIGIFQAFYFWYFAVR